MARPDDPKPDTYWALVHYVASRFARRLPANVEFDDLVGAGMLGLVQALRSTTEHPPKKTYLYARIRGAILDSLRTHDWLPRRMRDEVKAGSIATSIVFIDDLEPSWEEKVGTDDENSPRAQHDIQSAIARALGELPERDREIIQGIYFDGKTSKVLAEDWHVSSARISQLHSRAIVALRKKLRIFMREYSSNQYKE